MDQVGIVASRAGAVIVYGPQGCGKTRNAMALAVHFGVKRVIDEWMPGDRVEPGTLHLSQVEVFGAVAYESLKAKLGLTGDLATGAGETKIPVEMVQVHMLGFQFLQPDGTYRGILPDGSCARAPDSCTDLFDYLTEEGKALFRKGYRLALYGHVEVLNLTPHAGCPEQSV